MRVDTPDGTERGNLDSTGRLHCAREFSRLRAADERRAAVMSIHSLNELQRLILLAATVFVWFGPLFVLGKRWDARDASYREWLEKHQPGGPRWEPNRKTRLKRWVLGTGAFIGGFVVAIFIYAPLDSD